MIEVLVIPKSFNPSILKLKMIDITVDITKTVTGPTQYEVDLVVSAATGIEKELFVLDFPDLKFQQIANPYALENYVVYDPANPPVPGTKYVRSDTVVITFADPDAAVDGVISLKSQLEQLAKDWDISNSSFTGTEQYVINVP